jgi:hypothetical protein
MLVWFLQLPQNFLINLILVVVLLPVLTLPVLTWLVLTRLTAWAAVALSPTLLFHWDILPWRPLVLCSEWFKQSALFKIYIKWLKTLETETHMPPWWIQGIFQYLNQEIVISGKIINIHKYANEIIWIIDWRAVHKVSFDIINGRLKWNILERHVQSSRSIVNIHLTSLLFKAWDQNLMGAVFWIWVTS